MTFSGPSEDLEGWLRGQDRRRPAPVPVGSYLKILAVTARTAASAIRVSAPCGTSIFDQLVWPAVMRPPQLLRPSPLSYGWPVRVPGRPYALSELHGRKRGDEALLRRMRIVTAIAMPGLRLRE